MVHIKMKVGSRLTLPILPGWMVGSSDTSVIGASTSLGTLTLTGNGPGTSTLTLTLADDFDVRLDVGVEP